MTYIQKHELNGVINDTLKQLLHVQIFTLLLIFALGLLFWWDTDRYIAVNNKLIHENKQLIAANKDIAIANREFLARLATDIEVLKKNSESKRMK